MIADARRRSPVLCQSVTALPLQLSAFYCFAASISSGMKKIVCKNWKAGLKLPPVDTRYKTEIWWYTGAGTDCGAKHSLHATSPIIKQGSSAAAELDVERLKVEQQRSVQTIQQWKTIYENLHQFCVRNYTPPPPINNSIKMEVGIEDCLHIEFEYNKGKYHLNDVIVGKIYFLLVRIKLKNMDLEIRRRESTGSGANTHIETETLAKFELMDGAPVREECDIHGHNKPS